MSLFYCAHDVFATYTRIISSVQPLVNEEFFHQSIFELKKLPSLVQLLFKQLCSSMSDA